MVREWVAQKGMSTRNAQGHKAEGSREGGGPYDDLDARYTRERARVVANTFIEWIVDVSKTCCELSHS